MTIIVQSMKFGVLILLLVGTAVAVKASEIGFTVVGEIQNSENPGNPIAVGEGTMITIRSASGLSAFEAERFLPTGFTEPNCTFSEVSLPVAEDGTFTGEISQIEVLRGKGRTFCTFIIEVEAQGDQIYISRYSRLFGGEIKPGEVFPIVVEATNLSTRESVFRESTGSRELGPILGGLGGILVVVGSLLLLLWFAVLVARSAKRKGRNFWPWFWIAFFFLIPAAIIVAVMKNEPDAKTERLVPESRMSLPPRVDEKEFRNCPYCGEEILVVAKKCKHCGEFLETQT